MAGWARVSDFTGLKDMAFLLSENRFPGIWARARVRASASAEQDCCRSGNDASGDAVPVRALADADQRFARPAAADAVPAESQFQPPATPEPALLRDHPLVKDVRSIGMMAGVELHAGEGPAPRGPDIQTKLFWNGCHIKFTGDNAILAPMFVSERAHIDEIVGKLRATIDEIPH